jgi:hypothetical protein
MEGLGIRPGLDSSINAAEAVKANHEVPLRIEAQENPIPFEEMRVSKWGKVRSNVDRLKRHELYNGLRGDMKGLRKSLVQDRSRDVRWIELQVVFLVGWET